MEKKKLYPRIFFLTVIILFAGMAAFGDDNEVVKLSGAIFRQGDFFQVMVNAPQTSTVQVTFLGEKQRLQWADSGNFVGLVAVSYYATPGDRTLKVEINDETSAPTGDGTQYTYQITVLKRLFPESRIKIPEKTKKEILTPENQAADSQKAQEVRGKAQIEMIPPLWEGVFTWPLKGRISTEFGLIRYANGVEYERHSGLDITGAAGTPVTAVNNGRVIFAGKLYLSGNTVILHHGLNLYTTYCHFSAIKVQEGDEVSKGEVIGLVGATGLATGPHLHLTFRVGDVAVNPYLFLDKELKWEF